MNHVKRDDPGGLLVSAALAGAAGVLATAVAWVVWDLGLNGAVFVGVIVALLVLVFLIIAFGKQPSAAGTAPEQPAERPAAAPEPEAVVPAAPAPVAEASTAQDPAATSVAQRPAALDGPRDGGADDLKMIKGVGPKMESMLHSLGFYHFDQVASWTTAEVAWVDDNLEGFKGRVSRDDWVEQAKLLAAGGETEFSKKVEGGDVY